MRTDVIVIGAGIAGASAAAELAKFGSVALLEREERPGYHTTGRSAAMLMAGYGETVFRILTTLSEPFLRAPPTGFASTDLLKPRGCLYVGADGEEELIARSGTEMRSLRADIEDVTPAWIAARVPIMRPERLCGGLWDATSAEIDVHALHEGYLRSFRRSGGTLVTNCDAARFERKDTTWQVRAGDELFEAPVVVNAAGAWADGVAAAMGAKPKGVTPYRRTAVLIDPPQGLPIDAWPLVIHADEAYYFKPDAGKILLSPADEMPMPPCDVQPEELDVAVAVDRFVTSTTLSVKRITHSWAGLRSFAPDRRPIAGFDPDVEGLFWLAGQGGSGIMSAPALARAAALLVNGKAWPAEFSALGLEPAMLSPARFGG